ncbi:ribonuclease III [Prochlorococcus sp. MIT 1341]|uniref:ribonuclease III n=1 Tax=Prochlorococcus sp. MIT 1341 TaxID=3096221 RepID=UPI002A765BDC|nr:ribonuclease III [Prochlorococcus sp. MIT 1341]
MKDSSSRRMTIQRVTALREFLRRLKIDHFSSNSPSRKKTESLDLIDEALTHTSANQPKNHEKLEFLGDAVLRLVASEFIERHFPKMNVGERSALRAQLVSDRWLAEVGEQIKIEEVLIIGKKAAGDSFGKSTLQAEATEALIGAIYQYWEDLEPIHTWLTPYWIKESESILANPENYNCKSALQEWCQSKRKSVPVYRSEEKNLDHGNPKRFFSRVYLNEESLGFGWGRSKRGSEQEAARQALEKLKRNNTKNDKD